MYYYELAPTDRTFHGDDFLTYQSPDSLEIGKIVVVKLRTKKVTAFVVKKVAKPSFSTKNIEQVTSYRVPAQLLGLWTWVNEYYPGPRGLTASLFTPPSIAVDKTKKELVVRAEQKNYEQPPLTKEQQSAIKSINTSSISTTLLHGETGSGKTRVYIELAKQAVAKGKSVLVLTPEIALTPQLVRTFEDQFSNVQVTHSHLTPARRRKLWDALSRSSEPTIVIGPRSALFMPIPNIGLIAIDEFHESAYKNEQTPHYNAVRVAAKLAYIHGAQLVLGSATPSISEYFLAEQKQIPIIRMKEKALKADTQKTKFTLVNLSESEQRSSYPLLSQPLLGAIDSALAKNEQILLFLNRRGSARATVCQQCGWRALCIRCDLPMVYHQDDHYIQCHTCGRRDTAPNSCPECGHSELHFKSPGTKAITEYLTTRFPSAKIARFDKDNTSEERLDKRHHEAVSGDIDILIGTQLLAKGHDLPSLSLVGILLADSELLFPDFSSAERSFQLLHQIAGRVGRGHQANSHVVIQTYNPESPAIDSLMHGIDWDEFYADELSERKQYGFPPFYHALKVEVARAQNNTAQTAIQTIADELLSTHSKIELVGPSPSFIAKRNNQYHWQLIVKAKNRALLVEIARALPARTTFDIDPLQLL